MKNDDSKNKKKIIPCLDFANGKVVKGVNFDNIKAVGDAVENAVFYQSQGADELVFLDITATTDGRETLVNEVKRLTQSIKIPLTVGGGINSVAAAEKILSAGASKVGINTAAILNPQLLTDCIKEFGVSKIVLAIDAKQIAGNKWSLVSHGGKKILEQDALEWANKAVGLGVKNILPTSLDRDGALTGYDIPLTRAIADIKGTSVIASGGAGTMQHFLDAFVLGHADAALAASLFHYRTIEIGALKKYLRENNVVV